MRARFRGPVRGRIRRLLCLILALMATGAPALCAMQVVTNAQAPVFDAADDSDQSAVVARGTQLRLLGCLGSWGRVARGGRTGYMQLRYLDLKTPVKVYLVKDAALYAAAGTDQTGTLSRGEAVYFVGAEGDYACVTNAARTQRGYVEKAALARSKKALLRSTTTDPAQSPIEYAIYVAQNLLDRPYALDSDPPKSFNCATFVAWCYNRARSGSVNLSLTGQSLTGDHPKITSIGSLKRGDLVCFKTTSRGAALDHVGICLGAGYFIHASPSAGGVTVSRLTSGYYRSVFCWGLRIFDH